MIPDRFREDRDEEGRSDFEQEALDDQRAPESWANHPGRISYEEMHRRVREARETPETAGRLF